MLCISGFINGTIKKPTPDHADYENWMTVNSMIVGWIRVSIEPKVRSTVTFIAVSFQLWSNLKQRFSVHNKVRLHQLKGQISTCRQDGQSVLQYFGKLSSLWEEYFLLRPLPVCTCRVADTLSKERDEDKVHDFLLGLDDVRYGNLCTTIIGLDPLPTLEEFYSKAIREEQRIASARGRENQHDSLGLVTRSTQQQDASSTTADVITISDTQSTARPDTILRTRVDLCCVLTVVAMATKNETVGSLLDIQTGGPNATSKVLVEEEHVVVEDVVVAEL